MCPVLQAMSTHTGGQGSPPDASAPTSQPTPRGTTAVATLAMT